MPDLDTGVIDLCRRTPRKRKSKTRPFRYMTSHASERTAAPHSGQTANKLLLRIGVLPFVGVQPNCTTLELSYGTMASADVMAITKWSIFRSSHVGATLGKHRHRGLLAASAALDWLDVMHPAAIPIRAEPTATRCGEMVE